MGELAKRVVSSESGKVLGYVLDVAIDYEGLTQIGFYVVDEETEGEYLLRFEDIEKIGDVLFVADFSRLEFVSDRQKNMIGKELVSEEGVSLGFINSLEFVGRKLFRVCTNFCELPSKMISLVGEDCVFLRRKHKKVRKQNPFKSLEQEPKVVAFSEEKEKEFPQKINLSFSLFSGKLASSDVFGYNNERIVLKNEKITRVVFENAKKHNKLNELFFAIKK